MIYNELNGITCRKAESRDASAIFELIKPYIHRESSHKSLQEVEIRTLEKLCRHAITSGNGAVCEKDGTVVGGYLGKGNSILYIANEAGVEGAALLFKTVLCDLHNKFEESHFKVDVQTKQKEIYENIKTRDGELACPIDNKGRGVVSLDAKLDIEHLFNTLKG